MNEGENPEDYATIATLMRFLAQESVFANLMVISTSLALGLLMGFAMIMMVRRIRVRACECCGSKRGNLSQEDEVVELSQVRGDGEGAGDVRQGSKFIQLRNNQKKRFQESQRLKTDRIAGMFASANEDPNSGGEDDCDEQDERKALIRQR